MERMVPTPTEPRYLRTAQVAELLHVSPKTVSRWAQEGRLPYLRTLGGHRRYPDAEIRALVETLSESSAWSPEARWTSTVDPARPKRGERRSAWLSPKDRSTAVNGTLVARPARTTCQPLAPGSDRGA